jgi:hypothetical protein
MEDELTYIDIKDVGREVLLTALHELIVSRDGIPFLISIQQILDLVTPSSNPDNLIVGSGAPDPDLVGVDGNYYLDKQNLLFYGPKLLGSWGVGIALGGVGNEYLHPNHMGDVTSAGDGATVIAAKAVTLAKMADVQGGSIFYRRTPGGGNPETQSLEILKQDLAILTMKPVISICATLPDAGMQSGDRYFMVNGDNALKIAEWSGFIWNLFETVEGNSFYSYSQKNFIVRTKTSYDIAAGNIPFADNFTDAVTTVIMTGNVNGLNRIFRTPEAFKLGTLIVFVNGINEKEFTVLDNLTIQMNEAPLEGDVILAVYNKSLIN